MNIKVYQGFIDLLHESVILGYQDDIDDQDLEELIMDDIEEYIEPYVSKTLKKEEVCKFRIEIINEEKPCVYNLFWTTYRDYFGSCSIESYIHSLITDKTNEIVFDEKEARAYYRS